MPWPTLCGFGDGPFDGGYGRSGAVTHGTSCHAILGYSAVKHPAFGFGPHLCLGMHLARLEIRAFFRELLPRLDHIELAGKPAWVEANFVNGLKRMPVRYTMSKVAA